MGIPGHVASDAAPTCEFVVASFRGAISSGSPSTNGHAVAGYSSTDIDSRMLDQSHSGTLYSWRSAKLTLQDTYSQSKRACNGVRVNRGLAMPTNKNRWIHLEGGTYQHARVSKLTSMIATSYHRNLSGSTVVLNGVSIG
jgi:hypothetical protein